MERIGISHASQDTLLLPSNSGQAQEEGRNQPEASSAKARPGRSPLTARVNTPLPRSTRRVWDPQGVTEARCWLGWPHIGACSLPG